MSETTLVLLGIFVAFVLFELSVGLRSGRQLARVADTLARDPLVFDVRTGLEFRTGHLPGAVSMPLSTLLIRARKESRERPVIVYCASGTRSLLAAFLLRRLGFQEVIDLGPLRNAGKLPPPKTDEPPSA